MGRTIRSFHIVVYNLIIHRCVLFSESEGAA